ncbi:MAG: ankyrin repeat domain-containing protein [Sulfurimonadaceae bacterium]|nr:ankyrin repeat domain-containing protein [Sulfurimonadaceae bacterium]
MDKWIEILKKNDYLNAKKYIKEGADVNEENDAGESVLSHAIRYLCDFELLMLLIESGANIFDFDDEGVSVFDIAITYTNIPMVLFMIEQGVDVNKTQRRSGFTPLMAASCYGRVEIAKILLEHGADKDIVDFKGFSATDFARKMNKKSILELLDFDPNAPINRSYAR